MRRFLAVLLSTSCPLLCGGAGAMPQRSGTRGRIQRVGGARRGALSLRRAGRFSGRQRAKRLNVNVDERDARGERETPYVGIRPTAACASSAHAGSATKRKRSVRSCRSSRKISRASRGATIGSGKVRCRAASHLTRFAVLGVGADRLPETGRVARRAARRRLEFAMARNDALRCDWLVPSAITLNGHICGAFDGAASGNVAMSIRLTRDTFKH